MTFGREKNASRPLADYDRVPDAAPSEDELESTGAELEGTSSSDRTLGKTAVVPTEMRATTGYGLRHDDKTPKPPEGLTYSA